MYVHTFSIVLRRINDRDRIQIPNQNMRQRNYERENLETFPLLTRHVLAFQGNGVSP